MKLKKNEDQSVDTLPLLRIGNNPHPNFSEAVKPAGSLQHKGLERAAVPIWEEEVTERKIQGDFSYPRWRTGERVSE